MCKELVERAERLGHKVVKVRHGWMVYPIGEGKPAWISQNNGSKKLKNNRAALLRVGVTI